MSSRRPASRAATPVPVPAEVPTETASVAPSENGAPSAVKNSVVLGPNDRLVGQLYIEGDLRVSGTVDGAIEATGDIEVAGGGKVSGEITAYNRLIVGSGASLIGGDVRIARLTVQDGATFSGRVSMGKHQAAVPAEPPPVTQPVAEPASAEPVAAEPVGDDMSTPRASTGWTKRKKGR